MFVSPVTVAYTVQYGEGLRVQHKDVGAFRTEHKAGYGVVLGMTLLEGRNAGDDSLERAGLVMLVLLLLLLVLLLVLLVMWGPVGSTGNVSYVSAVSDVGAASDFGDVGVVIEVGAVDAFGDPRFSSSCCLCSQFVLAVLQINLLFDRVEIVSFLKSCILRKLI